MRVELFKGLLHVDFEWSHCDGNIVSLLVNDLFLLVDDVGLRKLLDVFIPAESIADVPLRVLLVPDSTSLMRLWNKTAL